MSFLLLRARRKIVPLLPLGVLGGLGAKREEKIEFVMEFEIQFFSVAERPLTFFAYFLNAKKVGRRRLVIGPAKAGAFLFSHTRLPFPLRPLLPFSRISLRTPWAAVRFAAMASPPRTVIFPSPPQPRPQRHKAAVF